MKRLIPVLLTGVMLAATAACSDVSRTSGNAPANTEGNNGEQLNTQENKADATDQTRQSQLESDKRAIEQRNQAAGDTKQISDNDLQSLVRNKLEKDLPTSQLSVESKDGVVTIAGKVASQTELQRIKPLAQEVQGVKDVVVKATAGNT